MEFIPKNRILEFNTDQMKSVRKQYNLDKTGDMDQAIDVLEAWIKMQKHFKKDELPRYYLEKTILTNKGSLERVKNKLDKICTLRTLMPAFFGENLNKDRFEDIYNFKSALLPKPTDENYRIYMMKATGTFTSGLLLNFYRYVVWICEYILAHDYSDGIIIVVDYIDANVFELVKALDIMQLRQIIAIVTEGYAMRLKNIYLLTPSKAIETFVAIIKPMISPKLGKRIYVHKDINSIYQYIHKDLFPKDYGGKEKSLTELRDDLMDELTGTDFLNFIEEMSNAKTDESCRQIDTFNEKYLGMPGSFRQLHVD